MEAVDSKRKIVTKKAGSCFLDGSASSGASSIARSEQAAAGSLVELRANGNLHRGRCFFTVPSGRGSKSTGKMPFWSVPIFTDLRGAAWHYRNARPGAKTDLELVYQVLRLLDSGYCPACVVSAVLELAS